jgi:hypothetical protein
MESSDDVAGNTDVQIVVQSENEEDDLSLPSQPLQHRPKDHADKESEENESKDELSIVEKPPAQRLLLEIRIPAPAQPLEYEEVPENTIVSHVVEELERTGDELWYNISFEDGREEEVSE